MHEADNSRPVGEDYPEVFAAIEATYIDWLTAIRQILGKALGQPLSAPQVLRELLLTKPVKCSPEDPITLERLRVRLAHGLTAGLWVSAEGSAKDGLTGYTLAGFGNVASAMPTRGRLGGKPVKP